MARNTNKEFSYMDSVHRDGRIWNLTVMVILMAFPVAVGLIFSAMPDWVAVGKGLIATAPMYWAVGVIETVTYIPMLGAGGSYLSFVTGNISNLKLPCALNALENAEVKAQSEEGITSVEWCERATLRERLKTTYPTIKRLVERYVLK